MNITYNGLNINDQTNYWTEDLQHELPPKSEVNLQKLARTNESVILRKGYGIRTIKIIIIVEDSSLEAMDARMDTLKQAIESKDKNLDIDYSSGTRRYICSGFIENVDRNPRWARVTIRLECYKAFGEDTSNTTESFTGKTTSPYTDDIAIGGTAAAKPDITITINSLTFTGSKYIQIKNTDTGDYIRVTKDDWAASDVIAIYSGESIVTVNGNVTQYLGIMPIWNPGTNNWEYTDEFSARNVDIDFAYKKKWL